jgi:hypothetical protein
MKISTEKAINAYTTLMELSQKELPINVGFLLLTNIENLESVSKSFNEKRKELINKVCEKDEKGELIVDDKGGVKVTDPDKYNSEIVKLLNCDVEVTINIIPMESLSDITIKPSDLYNIRFMIEKETK